MIELIEKVDEHWYFAANADTDMCEGLVQARQLKIIKRLPGQDTVAGFEEGPCAVAMHDFQGGEEGGRERGRYVGREIVSVSLLHCDIPEYPWLLE